MAFNGSGVFNRLYNWVNDAAASIKIRADRMDAEMDGFATGLSTCITKNGQTTITANLPMSTYRHTGVGNASARTDYASYGQLQDGTVNWVDAGGTADAITATYSPAVSTLSDGQVFHVRAGAANATTTPTFSPSGLTARTIVKTGGNALIAGDIVGDGHELILRYDSSNTRYELLNPAGVVSLGENQTISGNKTFSGNSTFTGTADFQGVTTISSKQLQLSKGADIASATALPLLTDGNFFDVTGTTAITSIDTSGKVGTEITLQFDGALTLTHHATDLILPRGLNITTEAGDVAKFVEYASGDWLCTSYTRANGKAIRSLSLGTAVSATSGTSVPFTGIASDAKRITLTVASLSTNGTQNMDLVIGDSGGNETSGYLGTVEREATNANLSSAFTVTIGGLSASSLLHGQIVLVLTDSATNTWTYTSLLSRSDTPQHFAAAGSKSLSGTLDRLQLEANGDTFDGGIVNILIEY